MLLALVAKGSCTGKNNIFGFLNEASRRNWRTAFSVLPTKGGGVGEIGAQISTEVSAKPFRFAHSVGAIIIQFQCVDK